MNSNEALVEATRLIDRGETASAVAFVEHAAHDGDPELYSFLGKLMEGGSGAGRNCERAISYYQRGIERGDRRFCPVRLGRLYLTGDCVERDFEKARDLFLVGDLEGDALGSFGLGMAYTLGANSEGDLRKGREAYRRALLRGNLLTIGLIGGNYQKAGCVWRGIALRVAGAIISLPIALAFPRSRFVKSL